MSELVRFNMFKEHILVLEIIAIVEIDLNRYIFLKNVCPVRLAVCVLLCNYVICKLYRHVYKLLHDIGSYCQILN